MWVYLFALIAIAIVVYLAKIKMDWKTLAAAFFIYFACMALWGAAAESFALNPTDLFSMLLYSAVGFALFWVVWHWLKSKGG